jgi:hypothetical protein
MKLTPQQELSGRSQTLPASPSWLHARPATVRQQLTELPCWHCRQARQHILKICPRLDAQALACGGEAEAYRCRLAPRGDTIKLFFVPLDEIGALV